MTPDRPWTLKQALEYISVLERARAGHDEDLLRWKALHVLSGGDDARAGPSESTLHLWQTPPIPAAQSYKHGGVGLGSAAALITRVMVQRPTGVYVELHVGNRIVYGAYWQQEAKGVPAEWLERAAPLLIHVPPRQSVTVKLLAADDAACDPGVVGLLGLTYEDE